ncbi:HEPN-associated N-terminal domain-containing protein [Saccharopolyspora shandongensis]|uniref:HEPN-associated N-terminal domain-containing protein n=1 Tax=Saccharopolyspora shandongensis TaxID=418495 RepID=UPI0033E7A0CF
MDCIVDDDLRTAAGQHLVERECTFCGATADEGVDEPIAASFDDFMTIIMEALWCVYTSPEGTLAWDSEDKEWVGGTVVSTTDAVYDVCAYDVTSAVLDAIVEVIPEQDWTADDIAQLRPDEALRFSWEEFRDKVKYRSRFVFLSTPEEHSDHPDEFTTEEFLQKVDVVLRDNGTLLPVPAGHRFWRGRLTDDPANARVWNNAAQLGPPPRELAFNNRMSPAGITMFYGSDDIATAIAEISAHSTQRHAVLGQFETTRDLTLLNLTDLPPVPSLYTEAGRTQQRYDLTFLHRFATDLRKPVVFDGREHIEYVPTQVLTEYLRYVSTNAVDGILYHSAQNNGVCCVLFCDSTRCIDPGQTPDRYTKPWLRLHPDSVHSVPIASTSPK